MKKYSLYCHLPSQLDRLHTALNELSCPQIPRTVHFINYLSANSFSFHFQTPQEPKHKSAKLPIMEIAL